MEYRKFSRKSYGITNTSLFLSRDRQEQCVAEVKEAKLESDGFMITQTQCSLTSLDLLLNLFLKRVIQITFNSTKNTSTVEVCRRKHFLSGRAAVNSIHYVNTTKAQSLFLIFYKYQTAADPFKIGLRRTARVVRYSTSYWYMRNGVILVFRKKIFRF